MSPGALLKLSRMQPPVRRVLALDAGSRRIKLLLAESDFGRLRLLKEEMVDLQAEGLVSSDEIKTHLLKRLEDWGNPPLALILPQHLSISQVIDLPLGPDSDVEKQIADESVKLGGVSESRIVFDFVRTESPDKNRQQFWVTLSQEGDIRERILRLGVEHEDLCELTTTANALIAAYRAASPLSSRAALVHLGAQTTVVVIVLAGQGAFATSFQMGGDFFTRALARLHNCAEEIAEGQKRADNLFTGPKASPEFVAVVKGWVAELRRQLNDWFEHNPALATEAASFELVASGGGFDQPGLLDFLKTEAGLSLRSWPHPGSRDAAAPSSGFEVAFGAALQALGFSAQPVSLLPDDYRLAWRKRLGRQRLELASALLVVLCVLVLGIGTWRQANLIGRKEALLKKVQAGQDAVQANLDMTGDLTSEYEELRPIFVAQQNTLDTLQALALLQQTRSNRDYWYVLLADQQSYFSPPPSLAAASRASRTNLPAGTAERPRPNVPDFLAPPPSTNLWAVQPGLIAELAIPGEAEASRAVLSQLVNELKKQKLFSKVDLLSDDLRRTLADPKVLVTDRDYVLALDFSSTEYQQAIGARRPPSPRSARSNEKRPAHPPSSPAPGADGGAQAP